MAERPSERFVARLAERAVASPRRTIALWLVLALVGLALAALRLELRTSNLDLVDPELPEVARFLDVARTFGTPNTLVVVLEGTDPAALRRAVDGLVVDLQSIAGVRSVLGRRPLPAVPGLLRGFDPYLASADGQLLVVFVQPSDPRSSATELAPLVAAVRDHLQRMDLAAAGIEAGLTGIPAYALDDRDVIRADVSQLSVLGLVLVGALFVVAFGSWRRPLLAVVALLPVLGVTLGLAALWPGHLTLVSAFFASILIGLGIDTGIHVVDRIEEHLDQPLATAILVAVRGDARALLAATVTTGAALVSLLACGFRGFAELGAIAAAGLLVSLLAMVSLLPALLLVVGGDRGRGGRRRLGHWMVSVQHPLVAAMAIAGVVALAALGGPGFDGDYRHLEPLGSQTVRLEQEVRERTPYATESALLVAADHQELVRIVEELRDDPGVDSVHSALDLEALAALGAPIPAELWSQVRSEDGRYLVAAHLVDDLWDQSESSGIVERLRAIDPGVTGMPVLGPFLVARTWRAFRLAAVLGGLLVAAWVAWVVRHPVWITLALSPTVGTFLALPGAMKAMGYAFNPLSLMAVPLILGIAVDDGIHLVHRFRAEGGDLRRTLVGTGRSVVLTSATTLAAFGALALARHRGLASFAAVLSAGVVIALLLSILVLPTLMSWAWRRFGA